MSEDGTRKLCPYEMCQDLSGFKRLDLHLLKANDALYDLMPDVSTCEKYKKVKGCLVNILNKKRNALK